MDNSVIVSLRDIVVEFDGQRILDGLNLDIHDKEFVTLLGSSGCGKTTTLRLIAGFLEPNPGKVLLKGEDITGVPPYKRPVNTVFQKYALFPHLNVFENVAFGLRLKKMDEETIRRKVRDMLEVVGLKGFERRSISQMSGGQQQRVAIARSLVNEPEILLLDEPLGALDLKLRKEMQLELKRLQREMNITFIYVTHDQEEALTMSDTVVVMNGGKVQQIGTPEDIYNEPEERLRGRLHRRLQHRGRRDAPGLPRFVLGCGFPLRGPRLRPGTERAGGRPPGGHRGGLPDGGPADRRGQRRDLQGRPLRNACGLRGPRAGSSTPPAPARPARPSGCGSAPTRSTSWHGPRGDAAMMKIYDKKLAYPYFVWMTLFTVVPLFIVGYYALTDARAVLRWTI